MLLTIVSIDDPPELAMQSPVVVRLVRQIPGPDRPDYWLAEVLQPLQVVLNDQTTDISHVVLTARRQGAAITSGVQQLPVNIAYVVDPALLAEATLDLAKCRYVAIGTCSDSRSMLADERRAASPDDR